MNSVKKENDQRTPDTSNPKRQQLVYNCIFSMARKTHPIRAVGLKGVKYKETRGGLRILHNIVHSSPSKTEGKR